MRHEVHTPPPHAEVVGEMADAELEVVTGGGQKGQVVARAALPAQWGGRPPRSAGAAVRPAAAQVAAVTAAGGCFGGVCRSR